MSSCSEKEEAANLLIAKGADVSAQDYYGRSPLISAINSGMVKVVEKLIQNGADGKLVHMFNKFSLSGEISLE